MSSLMKIIMNFKISSDMNTSVSFEHIVTDEDDAKSCGEQDKLLYTAYMEGFGNE